MIKTAYEAWVGEFEAERDHRAALGDPDWERGARLPVEIVRSIQKFQVGEDGDGSALSGKADRAGDLAYASAVRLFVAEEQNHARMLSLLLAAAGAGTLDGHWSDAAFVRVRRLMGLRVELLVLMIAEAVALEYYRALRDGAADPLASEVAGRILADEERHVPFHCLRLHEGLAGLPGPVRRAVATGWRGLLACAAVLVAVDHGPALRALGTGRRGFVARAVRSSAGMARAMSDGPVPAPGAAAGAAAPAASGPARTAGRPPAAV
ncbi:ferritin-like domain-containing protein [Streptomyces sp. NPDC055254]